jgi:hypothetical protein
MREGTRLVVVSRLIMICKVQHKEKTRLFCLLNPVEMSVNVDSSLNFRPLDLEGLLMDCLIVK